MQTIIFVHGMFQNPKSWEKWTNYFSTRGYQCVTHAWPYHAGDPAFLRENPAAELGNLRLRDVINAIEDVVRKCDTPPIMIGHSVGGLITQIMVNRGLVAYGVAINSVAPNAMLDFDFSSMKNMAVIANPLKGDEPIYMDAETFHGAFANTLSKDTATHAYNDFATHDSRNVLRDCMGDDGRVDVDKPHNPLLLIAGDKDEIISPELVERNAKAYTDKASVTAYKNFPNRSHYICGEVGWEEVADYAFDWLKDVGAAPVVRDVNGMPIKAAS